jgi:16S rRNA pseudouridine516 synthase
MTHIRLDRLLSNLGYGSRRDVSALVKRGFFVLDGRPVTDPSKNISYEKSALSTAYVDGEVLDPISPLHLILHKPVNYTCSHDEQGLIVFDLLPARFHRRKPLLSVAGRLDKDSTGLVFLTDDGDMLHKIISPKHHVVKRYHVTLRDALRGDEAIIFADNFCLKNDPSPLKPAQWDVIDDHTGIMHLSEGRFRQIRRMFATIGNEVTALHRFQIGKLELGDLNLGEYRIATEEDIQKIFGKS